MGMVMSQWQWLRASLLRPVFSDPKSRATRAVPGADGLSAGLRQRIQRMFLFSFPYCGGAHDQVAIRYCICDGTNSRAVARMSDASMADRAFSKADRIVIHQPQIGKAKTVHGPGDGADIVGISRAYQHQGNPGALLFAQHRLLGGQKGHRAQIESRRDRLEASTARFERWKTADPSLRSG